VNLGRRSSSRARPVPRGARSTSSSGTPTSSTNSTAPAAWRSSFPDDRPYGLRDYTGQDLHGYRLTFGHHTFDAGPPLEIERVDVPVRLEKRLAAVLGDLAAFKHMSLSSCLEETLLHTFEPLGDGVASPHTRTHLRHIQELKTRHGIDYDSHASYRFVER
jgi:hypothetical protein